VLSPPAKPKMSAEERRHRHEDRLKTIRLRMAIWHELDECGITTPAEIGVAFGMTVAEAARLLARYQWRESDVVVLAAAAAWLGPQVSEPPQLFGGARR
jgi:hypothetical protein